MIGSNPRESSAIGCRSDNCSRIIKLRSPYGEYSIKMTMVKTIPLTMQSNVSRK